MLVKYNAILAAVPMAIQDQYFPMLNTQRSALHLISDQFIQVLTHHKEQRNGKLLFFVINGRKILDSFMKQMELKMFYVHNSLRQSQRYISKDIKTQSPNSSILLSETFSLVYSPILVQSQMKNYQKKKVTSVLAFLTLQNLWTISTALLKTFKAWPMLPVCPIQIDKLSQLVCN